MFKCSKCGGTNIQMLAWIDANTNEYKGEGPGEETEDNWCEDCQKHVEFDWVSNDEEE